MVARPGPRLRAGPHVYPRGSDRRPAPGGSGGKRPVREGAGAGHCRGPRGPGGPQREGRALCRTGPLRPQRVPGARRSPRRAGGPAREDVREPAAGRAGRHQLAAARCTAARGTPRPVDRSRPRQRADAPCARDRRDGGPLWRGVAPGGRRPAGAARRGGSRARRAAPAGVGIAGDRGPCARAVPAGGGAGRARHRSRARISRSCSHRSARRQSDRPLRARRARGAGAALRRLHGAGCRVRGAGRRAALAARAPRRAGWPRRSRDGAGGEAWTHTGPGIAAPERRRGPARCGRRNAARGGAVAGPRAARAEARLTLAGVRVLVTRAVEDAPELEALLRDRGAAPVRMPCIAFQDGPDSARIAAIVGSGQADLIVVSSPHAARRLLALCGPIRVPIAAVGAATARELPGDVLVPRQGVGADALVRELGGRVAGQRVLVPRAEEGNPALADGLRAAGAQVEELVLYRTVTAPQAEPAALRALGEGAIDAIAFASGSAARGFVALAGVRAAGQAAVACMGRRCAGDARGAGLRVDAVADGGLTELCEAVALAVRVRKR